MLHGLLLRLTLNLWVGEVFNLRWEHVNFTDGTITVMDSKNAMNRVVYMPEQVKDMLVKHQAETKGQPGRLGVRLPVRNEVDFCPVSTLVVAVMFRYSIWN